MKWVIFAEIALAVICIFGAIYSQATAKSTDEAIISAPLWLFAIVFIVATFLTLLGWWGWLVTFRA